MADEETLAMRQLLRQLKGEIVNGEVGIPLRGGPYDGRSTLCDSAAMVNRLHMYAGASTAIRCGTCTR